MAPQHDFILDNQNGAQFRADVNLALEAIATVSSGAVEPTTTYAYQYWADTTTGYLKQRDASNANWIVKGNLAADYGQAGQVLTSAGAGVPAIWTSITEDGAWTVAQDSTNAHFTFTGNGFDGTEANPDIYLVRGAVYNFTNASTTKGFQIQSTAGLSGTAYNDGITTNPALAPDSSTVSTLVWTVQMDAPSELYYHSTVDAGPGGNIYILDAAGGELEWTLTANGTTDYIFAGPGFAGTETDPDLYVVRGQTYKFTNSMGAHPFQIQSTQGTSGTAYNDGITNNAVSNGTLTWEVRMDAPSTLYYQCTSHADMNGTIRVLDVGSTATVASIDDIGDVDTTTVAPTDGQALLWDNAAQKWEPGTVSGGGTSLPSGSSDGEALIWENGAWAVGPVIGGVDYSTSAGSQVNTYAPPTGYTIWNDTWVKGAGAASQTLSNNDLTVTMTGGTENQAGSSTDKSTGKWYWEIEATTIDDDHGGSPATDTAYGITVDPNIVYHNSNQTGTAVQHDGSWRGNNGGTRVNTSGYTDGDILMFALDVDNKKLFVGKNGTWENSGDPVAGTGAVFYNWTTSNPAWHFFVRSYGVGNVSTIATYLSTTVTNTVIPYSIDKLDDVDTSTVAPTDGQALLWDAANNKWEPGTVSTSSSGGGVTTTTPWAPTDLTLSMWLDADDASTITESGGAVSAWNDKTANAFNVAQATAANQPTLTANGLNGKSVITFDGTNDYLSVPPSIQAQPMTVALVCKANSTAASGGGTGRAYVFDGMGTSTTGRALLALDGNNNGYAGIYAGGTGLWVTDSTATFDTNAHIFVLNFNGASSSLKFDGGIAATGTLGTLGLTNGVTLGANYNQTADWFNGAIAEFIVLPAVQSDDQEKLEGYLAHKWGLEASLPAAHPYKSAAPVNTEIAPLPSGTADGEALIWQNGAWAVGPVIGGVNYTVSAGAQVSTYTPPSGFSQWNDTWTLGLQQQSGTTLSNNNLTATVNAGSGGERIVGSATAYSTGKYYWEIEWVAGGAPLIGVAISLNGLIHTGSNGTVVQPNGSWFNGLGGTTVNLTGSYSTGDIIGFAIDFDAKKMWIARNNTWENSGNPAAGTGAVWSGWSGTPSLSFAVRMYYAGDSISKSNYLSPGSTVTIPAADSIRTLLGIDEYADDTAAGTGGVASGALYYNTTSSDYRLKS